MTIISNLISGAMKTGSGLIGGIWIYAAVAVAAAGVATYATHHWDEVTILQDQVKYKALQLKDAENVTTALEAQAAALTKVAAEQHALDTEVAHGAVAEAQAQGKLGEHTRTILKEIPRYVPEVINRLVPCIPYAVVRVLDAAALSTAEHPVSPGDLTLPPGKSDDACADFKASDLAASIAGNYGLAGQNAEQLNALIAATKTEIDKANAK
jgi:hypothetical protein